MASSSLKNASPNEAQSQVSALPVDTFTEQLTHEPQRKAKLYSLPLIRTAVALVTALWVVGVYVGNPDGFWQAQTNTFMVAIAGLAVAWAVGGWMTCLIRRGVGVAIPKRSGDVEVDSFTVPLTIRRESSSEWFKLVDRHLVVSLEGDGLESGVAVIPLDLLKVSYDLLEGDSPRMEAHLSDIKYDTRYGTWTLHLPASYAKRWKPILADAKASDRVTTGREPKFNSKAVRTYTWKTDIEWDAPYMSILLTTIIGYAIVASLLAGWATSPQRSATESVLASVLFALIVLATSAGFTFVGYIGYDGQVGYLNPWRYYCQEAVPMLTDSEKSVISLAGGWVFPLVKFKNGGRYGGWVLESKGVRQVVLLAPSGRQYILDLPRDTTIHYSSDPKRSCAIATLKIGDEVVGAKLTLPKDAEPTL
jgi:hypothetical protein